MLGVADARFSGGALYRKRPPPILNGVHGCFNGKRLRAVRMFEVMFAVVIL